MAPAGPLAMLAEQQQRLHRLPETPRCSRRLTNPLGNRRSASARRPARSRASSPMRRCGTRYGDHLVVAHRASPGSIEVARHQRRTLGHPMIDDTRYPPRPAGPLRRCRDPRSRLRPPGCGSSKPRLQTHHRPRPRSPKPSPWPDGIVRCEFASPWPLELKREEAPAVAGASSGLVVPEGSSGADVAALRSRWFPSSSAGDGHYSAGPVLTVSTNWVFSSSSS